MKVLFVTRFFVHDNFGRDPLGILYLSAALKKAGHKVALADAARSGEVMRVFKDFDPDAIGFSITTSTYNDYLPINEEMKKEKPGVYSIFGGPHCTFHPEFFEDIPAIDAICLGEGEEAFVDFLNRMERGGRYEETPNFYVRHNGRIVKNDVRPLIKDIDSIPRPDRDLLDIYPDVSDFPVKTFITTRGCPFDCTYCYNFAYAELYKGKGQRVRYKAVDSVLAEIEEERAKREISFINFEDDIFGMNTTWLKEFAGKYTARIGIPFCCNVRVEYINEETVRLLKKSGCHAAVMGIEFGDHVVRKSLLNREMTNDEVVKACRCIRDAAIVLEAENILGLPGISFEEEKATVLLNIACKPDYPASYVFQPQPKTVLGRIAIERNLFDGNYGKMGNYYNELVLKHRDKAKLLRLRSLFFFLVRYPFLYRFMDVLVNLPIGGVYYALHAVARGYMARFRIMPYRFRLGEFFRQLYRYLVCK